MSNHGRPPPQNAERQIVELTHRWVGQCHGLDIIVPLGAAFNVIYTCSKSTPVSIKQGVINTLQGMIERLQATIPEASNDPAAGG